MQNLEIQSLIVGPLQTNCYFLADKTTKAVAIIDPGGDAQRILRHIRDNALQVSAVLLTHGHYDHIGALGELYNHLQCPLRIHAEDEAMLRDPVMNLSHFLGCPMEFDGKVEPIAEGDSIEIGSAGITVIETPGHTRGSVSFYSKYSGFCVVGDTLFKRSIGRTDLPGGSHPELIKSINEKLFILDDATRIFAGHGPSTEIGSEKRENPFVHDDSSF